MKIYWTFIIFLFCLFSPVSSLSGDIFRWVDERGVVHFTDNPHNIPEKFRENILRIEAREIPKEQESSSSPSPDKVAVPFQKKGQVVIVRAIINEKAAAKYVVDTGATYTMISKAMAKELGIALDKQLPTMPFQTANGLIQAPLISLSSIEVGGMQVKNLTAAVYDVFPDPSVAGLLGLNFLSHFRIDIDTENGILHLEKK